MLSKTKYPKLLLASFILYSIFLGAYFGFNFSFNNETIYSKQSINLFAELIMLSLFAPVIEELIFRAPLIMRTKKWLTISVILSLVLFFSSLSESVLKAGGILLWLVLILSLKVFNKTEKTGFLIIGSIFSFALSHLELEAFFTIDILVFACYFTASACLLTWVALNYGLIKAILCHALYNLLTFGVYLLFLNFAFNDSPRSSCMEENSICIEWKQRPLFESKTSTINYDKNSLEAKNTKIKNLLDLLQNLDLEKNNYIITEDARLKYDIKIKIENRETVTDQTILTALENAGLIKIEKQ